MERKQQLSKVHLHPGDHRGRDLSGHGKKATEWGALTNWRPQREGLLGHGKKATKHVVLTLWRPQRDRLVKIQKEIDQVKGTYKLETSEGGICQNTERK